jgi:predicted lipoprotein with Yx(FWY)xxD motif
MTIRLRGVAAAGVCALALALTACGGGDTQAAANPEHGAAGHDMSQMSPQDMANMPGMGDGTAGGDMGGMNMGGTPGQLQLWAVQSGPLGVVTTDGNGRIVYQFDEDSTQPPASTCVAADCLQAWEPILMPQQGVSGLGVDEAQVGTTIRPDGAKQVTLYGHPIYLHKGETGGLANSGANGADGVWWAINPYGAKADPLPATSK